MRIRSIVLVLAVILALPISGQETRSLIYGRVLDPQGAALTGAKVTVTNSDTNISVALITNETGYYEAGLLLPGNYEVRVQAAGFRNFIRKGIVLQVSTRAEIDINLELGALTDSVTVVAEAPLLDASSGYSGRVLDNKTQTQLPVSASNVTIFARLAPGIQSNGEIRWLGPGDQGSSSDYAVAGKVGGNEWTIDGAPNVSSRTVGFLPHGDTIAEVKIETSGFDASLGHSTGVSVALMTKSGTNQYHGTLNEMHMQDRWNAMAFKPRQLYYQRIAAAEAAGNTALAQKLRDTPKQPSGRTNQYAGTLGGPIVIPKILNGRDKLFFFFGFAGYRINSTQPLQEVGSTNYTFPTLANRLGDFSQLQKVDAVRYTVYDPLSVRADPARTGHYIRDPIPGNILPQNRIQNPAYNTYAKFLPVPNNPPASDSLEPVNNFIGTDIPDINAYESVTNRIDYNYSSKHRFFGRWYRDHQYLDANDWSFATYRGLMTSANSRHNISGTIDWTYIARANTMFDFSVALQEYRGGDGDDKPVALTFKPSDVGLPAYLDQKAGARHMLPQMSAAGYQAMGLGTNPIYTRYRTFQTKADASHIRGSHSIRGGLDMRQFFRTGGSGGNTSGSYSFTNNYTRRNDDTLTPAGNLGLSWAAFMLGIPSSMSIPTSDSYAIHSPYYAAYVMDNWRLTRKLNVNFGLRLEYEQGFDERYNRMIAYFDPKMQLPISAAAQAAYARNPIPQLPAAQFVVQGGPVYPGVGGVDRKVLQNQLMWLPRVAAAYELNSKTVVRGGYGMFYDTNSALLFSPNQLGFSRTTSTNLTDDFGVTWLTGDPANGISPLKDPFPVRSDGTRYDLPVRTALGNMAVAGSSYTFNDFNTKHARQQRWRVGVQRQIGRSTIIEAAYAGSSSDNVQITRNLSPLPAQYWADGLVRNDANANAMNANVTNPFLLANFADLKTSNPVVYQNMSTNGFFTSSTIRANQLLRPFPLMSGLNQSNAPFGKVRTDEFDISFERRFSKGVNFYAGYTRLRDDNADIYLNEFDAAPTWRESNNGRPHRLVMTGLWELPFGKGRAFLQHNIVGKIVGGWELGITYEGQPGPLLDFGNLFYYGNLSDIDTGTRMLDHWFNTANFERSSAKSVDAFHKRVFPTRIDGLRADPTNIWNANTQRELKFTERLRLRLRLDILNLTNRSHFAAPDTNPLDTDFGRVTNVTLTNKRFLQVQGRLSF